jgi:transcriptional regulator with XRE-family HTH domain
MSTGVEDLARAVIDRRAELGWTQRDLIARSHVSKNVIQALEGAEERSYRPVNKRAIEDALGWEYGSIDALLTQSGPARPKGQPSGIEQVSDLDFSTASYAELGAYADRLSAEAKDPSVGRLWYLGVLRRRGDVETSHTEPDERGRDAM